ncbi:ATP-binding cassette domain-containing protein [Roseospira visakhapatnamensis]|uniref:ABC-type sulfate/molybdate transport systems ATPase subunit n=1 Tax=Roseospira visakhapatnamensis TaxID=390880 RepID=A0A7W6RBC0_9PROT|nr:ATP-binding cassette domain-containing protein [Roseospira visakhapatnamensis]MBB4265212.1 ABC-type sulfate/molybdate transport systems ATPase subunit [Roseospira visakhapatnamensis]
MTGDDATAALPVRLRGVVALDGAGRRILDGIDASLPARGLLLVTGSGGAGKSALLQALAAVLPLRSGDIAIGDWTPAQAVRRQAIAAVFQHDALLPGFTVFENVLLPLLQGLRLPRRSAVLRAQVLLAQFGLIDEMHRPPRRLSDGQHRRALVARAMAVQPAVLLLDDVLAALDDPGRALMRRLLAPPGGRLATVVATATRAEDLLDLADGHLVLERGVPVRTTPAIEGRRNHPPVDSGGRDG